MTRDAITTEADFIVRHSPSVSSLLLTTISLLLLQSSVYSTSHAQRSDADEMRQQKVNDKYVQLLKRRPREGTALDRIYAFHVDRGTLNQLLTSLNAAVAEKPTDHASLMILGMVERRRGNDLAAKKAFIQAVKARPQDAVASWYLGITLKSLGETTEAAVALEQALKKKPPKSDAQEIYENLGRIYQQTHRNEDAISLWKRFEAEFPRDDRVQEKIASILMEEGDLEGALERFRKLSQRSTDPYRRTEFGIKSADLMMRLQRHEESIAAFEALLRDLKPGSWLFNDIRERIESAFLKDDDYAGLVDYYQIQLKERPGDVDLMVRIAKFLSWQDKRAEARDWYQRAVDKSATSVGPREAFAAYLVSEKQYGEAINQYVQLRALAPTNSNYIEEHGALWLKRTDLPRKECEGQASKIWKQLAESKPDDAVLTARVAELFKSARMAEGAIEFYKKAIELAPDRIQYREYLGEYYHLQNRAEDAKATWKVIAAGEKRSRVNLIRLSEIFEAFGYADDAVEAMQQACALSPLFADRIRLSTMLRNAERAEDSLKQLKLAETQAANDEEHEITLREQIKSHISAGSLESATTALHAQLSDTDSRIADDWRTLALYYEALGATPDSCAAAKKSVELEPDSVRAWSTAAKIMEGGGLIAEASAANARLVAIDGRYRSRYLRKLANLERRLGRLDSALNAGRDVVAASPDNPESYRFFAELCTSLQKPELALDALRQCVRVNPGDVAALKSLGKALAADFKTAEAIELYWRAFRKSDRPRDRMAIIQSLTDLYLRTNHFDKLIGRLENLARTQGRDRDITLCLANAYQASGDVGQAIETLEAVLAENTNDAVLLQELSDLTEQAGRYRESAEFQKRHNSLKPSSEGTFRLAELLLRAGDTSGADDQWTQFSSATTDPWHQIQSIDRLIVLQKYDIARRLTTGMLRSNAKDWEAMIRLVVIEWLDNDRSSALEYCQRLLALELPSDLDTHLTRYFRANNSKANAATQSAIRQRDTQQTVPRFVRESNTLAGMISVLNGGDSVAALRRRQQQAISKGTALSLSMYQEQQLLYPGRRAKSYLNIVSGQNFGNMQFNTYSEVRCAAIAAVMQNAVAEDKVDSLLSDFQTRAQSPPTSKPASPAWDWFFAAAAANAASSSEEQMAIADAIAKEGTAEASLAWLVIARSRHVELTAQSPSRESSSPLTGPQVARMLEAWQMISERHPDWLVYAGGAQAIVAELKAAGQEDKATQLYAQLVRNGSTRDELVAALEIVRRRGDVGELLELTKRLVRQETNATASAAQASGMNDMLGIVFAEVASMQDSNDSGRQSVGHLLTEFIGIRSGMLQSAGNASQSKTTVSYFSTTSHSIFTDGQKTGQQRFNTLAPDRFWTAADMTFFVNVYATFRSGHLNELVQILNRYRATVTGHTAVMTELALAHFRFLMAAHDEAAVHLTRAAELAPEESSLRINLVRFHQKAGHSADALALLETIDASDRTVMKQREFLALSLAGALGQTQRAKTAAERLFGLQLNSKDSIFLASKLRVLGMQEKSDALLARSRKSGATNLDTLLSLMNVHTTQGDTDIANQIAHQIMRQTKQSESKQSSATHQAARLAAMNVLGKSGQLNTLIERVKAQLEKAPDSIRLHQTLISYYKAAGRRSEVELASKKLLALQPRTDDDLIRDGKALESQRKYDQACEIYLAVAKRNPDQLAKRYSEYIRLFRRTNRLNELADVVLAMDALPVRTGYEIISELVQAMSASGVAHNSSSESRMLALFALGWEAYPNLHAEMLGNIGRMQNSGVSSLWELPQILQYAREAMIPQTRQDSIAHPWKGISESIARVPKSVGVVTSPFSRLLKSLKPDDLESFTTDVKAAVDQYESWLGGRLIIAILEASKGQHDSAKQSLHSVMTSQHQPCVPVMTAWFVGCELQAIDAQYVPLITKMLSDSVRLDRFATPASQYAKSAQYRLADLLSRNGQRPDARTVILNAAPQPRGPGKNAFLGTLSIANHLTTLQYPFDAVRYYEAMQQMRPGLETKFRNSPEGKRATLEAKSGVRDAIRQMTANRFVEWLEMHYRRQRDSGKPPAEIDLMLKPAAEAAGTQILQSVVLDGIKNLTREDVTNTDFIAQLKQISASVPDGDCSVAVMTTVLAESSGSEKLRQTALNLLKGHLSFVTENSVPPVDNEVALWLPAKTVMNSPEHRPLGLALADRAENAARTSGNEQWLLSILKSRGDIAIASGDKAAAEKAWSRLLDAVLADASVSVSRPGAVLKGMPGRVTPGVSAQSNRTASSLEELRKRLLKQPTSKTVVP